MTRSGLAFALAMFGVVAAIPLVAWAMSANLAVGAALAGGLGIGVAYMAAKVSYRSR